MQANNIRHHRANIGSCGATTATTSSASTANSAAEGNIGALQGRDVDALDAAEASEVPDLKKPLNIQGNDEAGAGGHCRRGTAANYARRCIIGRGRNTCELQSGGGGPRGADSQVSNELP